MNNLTKCAAAQKAIALMNRPGKQGLGFFRDLIKRQQGTPKEIKDFDISAQMKMLKNLASESSEETFSLFSGKDLGTRALKRLLGQGPGRSSNDFYRAPSFPAFSRKYKEKRNLQDLKDPSGMPLTFKPSNAGKLFSARAEQMDEALEHTRVLKRQQAAKREEAAAIADLLRAI